MSEQAEDPLPLSAFSGYGIELEYMIVDRHTLSVLPVADRLLHEEAGRKTNDVVRGRLGWSNELVLHVIEVKNVRPFPSLAGLGAAFHAEIRHINRTLERHHARLLPTAMHPWMDPQSETRLWPHDNDAIYRAYDRIFDSRSHGWANLQSMHVNLPFADDDEFARLHAAIRLVLPILPALAASSPIADGRDTGWADYRMHTYTHNAKSIPSITGMVVPETVTSRAAYAQRILAPMYHAIAPHDPERVLQQEWLNSRGAIARFDRNAIEIRVIDTQECPQADIAVATAAIGLARMLYEAGGEQLVAQQEMPTTALAKILQACIREAEQADIGDARYLRLLGYPGERCRAGDLWHDLIARLASNNDDMADECASAWRVMLEHGPLARRILRAVGSDYSPKRLRAVYGALADCAQEGRLFTELA
ncbi:MAG TPA: glutamate-cysteine ligase family protein [Noviherbaspirillum sp.]